MAPSPQGDKISLTRHVARGSVWMVAARWCDRLTGVVSTVILARLLTPTDYGIVAIATLVVSLVEVFSRTGQGAAVIRHPNPTREHYDSAWTISLATGLVLGLVILTISPLASAYFHEPRAVVVVQILAFRTMLAGAQNIGVVNFQRNLEFGKQWAFSIIPPLASFGVTIASAIVLRNYWALVIGLITESFVSLLLGYIMVPFRPRIGFSKMREMWSFSVWVLCRNIGSFLSEKTDQMAVGGMAGAPAMGSYTVANELATLPNRDLTGSVVSVLFPVMVKAQNDRAKLHDLYLVVLYWTAVISAAMATGIALVADDMVDLVLGEKWEVIKPLMPWLAFSYGVLGMGNSVYSVLTTIGEVRLAARLQWTRLITTAIAIFPVAYFIRDLEVVAMTRLLITFMVVPTLFHALMAPLNLTVRDYAVTLWRPIMAATAMTAVILGLNSVISFTGNPRLFLDVTAGALTYVATLMILWNMIGRPNGPEAEFWRRGCALIRKPKA